MNLFRGKSKQVWDYVWSVSRGAINPSRTIRKSRKEIKDGAKLGSMVTVDAAIEHLVKVELLKVIPNVGSIGGNEYEIFTPEETNLSSTSIASTSRYTSLTQKVDDLDVLESGNTSRGQVEEKKDSSGLPNTLLKTYKDDDDNARVIETFLGMTKKLDAAAKNITGKGVSKSEAEKWAILADLLILELEVAASRAGGVSSVPAFLTEVLRRQFFASRQQQSLNKSSKRKTDTVGKSETVSYEIKPLDEKGRVAALAQIREFTGEEFLDDFKKWYTADDWKWLMKELGIK
jgi:hypothetical protein